LSRHDTGLYQPVKATCEQRSPTATRGEQSWLMELSHRLEVRAMPSRDSS
jgi:hypothetical protein